MHKQPKGIMHNHKTNVIITSLLRIVFPLKNPSNVCLSYLDNGLKTRGVEFSVKPLMVSSLLQYKIPYLPLTESPFSSNASIPLCLVSSLPEVESETRLETNVMP